MCIVVYVPDPSIKVPKEYFESALNRNPDGYGIMAVIEGVPVVQKGGIPDGKAAKGKKTAEDVQAFLDHYDFFKNYPHAIHFRVQTDGAVDEENCHPYEVSEGVHMMHNGRLYQFAPNTSIKFLQSFCADKTKSDSWHFAHALKDFTSHRWLRNDSFLRLLNIIAGENNRLLFMDSKGFVLPRPDLWHQIDGVFYSNNNGIEQIQPSFRNKSTESRKHTPHGFPGPIALPGKKEGVAGINQNHGHYFTSNGTRIIVTELESGEIEVRKPESETSTSSVQVTPRVITGSPDETLRNLSFTEKLPQNLKQWRDLSLYTIQDLLLEEPESFADAVYELVHG